MPVGRAIINGSYIAVEYGLYGLFRIHRNTQVACQAVTRPKRDDSQNGIGVHQGFCHFINRAVAPGSQYVGKFVFHGLFGNLGGMTGIAGDPDNHVELGLVESGCHFFGDIFLRLRSRYRIDYDANAALFHVVYLVQK